MKTQLSILRLKDNSKQIVDLMKDLLKHNFKNSVPEKPNTEMKTITN